MYDNEEKEVKLEQSDREKDIGVLVDETISFSTHIQNQINKANSIMGLIRRTNTYLDEQKRLYKSLHQSFFYSFITILPSESGVTLHYSRILPQILLFRHLTSIFESTNAISRY